MNNTLAQSAQSGLTPNHRQQPPPNVQNAPTMIQNQNGANYISQSIPTNGMTGYVNTPNNAQHAQSYNGGYPVSQNPTMNLHKDALIYQNPNRPHHYEVYTPAYTNAAYQPQSYATQQPQYFYPQGYPGVPTIPQYAYTQMQPQAPVDPQYAYPQANNIPYNVGYQMHPPQQPQISAQSVTAQTAPTPQPVSARAKRVLTIVDPVTGENVKILPNKDTDKAVSPSPIEASAPPEPPVKEEYVEKDGEEVRKGFLLAVASAAKKDEVKEASPKQESPVPNVANVANVQNVPSVPSVPSIASVPSVPAVPKVFQQPTPALSAPPPTVNIIEEPKQIGTKSASMEPAINVEPPIQNNDVHLAPERSASPALAQTPEIKEQLQEDDDLEKLVELETRFKDLYTIKAEEIDNQVYTHDVLDIIHEIVKCYKKNLPPVDLEFLKKKGLDTQSELPQQMQGRSKYTNMTNTFNPGWASNQQVVGNRNKIYIGRHSDNKSMRKKGVPTRASFDKFSRQPPAPPILDLRKAENAWKPKRKGEVVEVDEEEKKYELLRKDIRSLLNKITPTNYEELIQDFFNMDVAQNERHQQIAIELIFDKAVEEPKFCSLYTKLCKEQVDRGKRTSGSFFYTLVRKIQATFEGDSVFDSSIKEITTQLNDETDEKKKADLSERLDMLKGKEKRYILGNIKFISHLYTVDLISDKVIAFCLSKLHCMFDEVNDEIYVQYGIELLELVANLYFGADKKKARNDDQNSGPDNVQSFVNWLSTTECKNNVSTKIRVQIMNFEDFMKAGYTKRNADKGPKTIQQLHEDIKKEEEINKTQRLAYEAEKQRETGGNRYQNQRVQYVGRTSLDRKNPQEKRISAAIAASSINSGSSAPPKKNTSLRSAMNDSLGSNKLKGPSYFAQQQQKKDGGAGPENAGWTMVESGIRGSNRGDDSRKSSLERN